jgi:hypothetical protein
MQRSKVGVTLAFFAWGLWCPAASADDFQTSCEKLSTGVKGSGRITEATFVPAGPVALPPPAPTAPAPAHCLIRGKINERTGIDGKPYAIGY